MPKMFLISSTTADSSQIVGDIVRTIDDGENITSIEQYLFDFQEITNVTVDEINAHYNSEYEKDPEAIYPRHPFTITDLTTQQKSDLADLGVNHDDTLTIIQQLIIKDPI